jgi:hypothetical protein
MLGMILRAAEDRFALQAAAPKVEPGVQIQPVSGPRSSQEISVDA